MQDDRNSPFAPLRSPWRLPQDQTSGHLLNLKCGRRGGTPSCPPMPKLPRALVWERLEKNVPPLATMLEKQGSRQPPLCARLRSCFSYASSARLVGTDGNNRTPARSSNLHPCKTKRKACKLVAHRSPRCHGGWSQATASQPALPAPATVFLIEHRSLNCFRPLETVFPNLLAFANHRALVQSAVPNLPRYAPRARTGSAPRLDGLEVAPRRQRNAEADHTAAAASSPNTGWEPHTSGAARMDQVSQGSIMGTSRANQKWDMRSPHHAGWSFVL